MFLHLDLVVHQKDPSHTLLLDGSHAASKPHSSRLKPQALKRIFLRPKVPEKVKKKKVLCGEEVSLTANLHSPAVYPHLHKSTWAFSEATRRSLASAGIGNIPVNLYHQQQHQPLQKLVFLQATTSASTAVIYCSSLTQLVKFQALISCTRWKCRSGPRHRNTSS